MANVRFFQRFSFMADSDGYADWLDTFRDPAHFDLVSSSASAWTVRANDNSYFYRDWTVTVQPAAGSSLSIVSGSDFPVGLLGRVEIRDQAGELVAVFEDLASLGLQVSSLGETLSSRIVDGADVFHGSTGQDSFAGGAGDDILHGSVAGDLFGDDLWGGDGNDILYGGPKGDSLFGEAGDDLIYIGVGGSFDEARGGDGNDIIRDGYGQAFGDAGDDQILDVGGELHGGDGNDFLRGGGKLYGDAGDDRLEAQEGDDILDGGTGEDVILGGGGDDRIYVDGLGDTIHAGAGDDRVFVAAGPDQQAYGRLFIQAGPDHPDDNDRLEFSRTGPAVQVRVSGFAFEGVSVHGFDHIGLTDGADRLKVIDGRVGEGLSVDAHGGDDVILGGDAWDFVSGGDGNDHLEGGSGDDLLRGDAGDDFIDGGAGDDRLHNGDGDDILIGGAGVDTVEMQGFLTDGERVSIDLRVTTAQQTGWGLDTLIGVENVEIGSTAGRAVTVIGNEAGNRLSVHALYGLNSTDDIRLEGLGGDDVLIGNLAFGGDGNDVLEGRELYGEAGDDVLRGRHVDGGDGIDLLYIDTDFTTQGFDFDALAGSTFVPPYGGGAVTFTYVNVERFQLFASFGDDILRGGHHADELSGNRGDDLIEGRGGDDILWGAEGSDILRGGDGNDVINQGAGDDIYEGGAGVDTLQLWAGWGVGATVDLAVTERQQTGGGFDLISGFENVIGSLWEGDVIKGDAGDNVLRGQGGDDVLVGRGGNDILDGGAGLDVAVFSGKMADYAIIVQGGLVIVKGADGSDRLYGVELLRFDDQEIDPLLVPHYLAPAAEPVVYVSYPDKSCSDDVDIPLIQPNDWIL